MVQTDPRLSALVYGPSGSGKSWLGSTVPPPRLIVDLEGRAGYTPNGQGATYWDGITDPFTLAKSPTRTYIVTVTDVSVLDSITTTLRSGNHPFVSVDVDSLMFAQMRTAYKIRPGVNDFLREQDWGTLLRRMERLVMDLHDMTMIPATKVRTAVFLAGSVLKNGAQEPMMQGQIGAKLPYLVDLAGYLDNARTDDGVLVRQLIVEPYPLAGIKAVKDGTHMIRTALGGVIANPDFGVFQDILKGGNHAEDEAGDNAGVAASE